MLISQSVSDSEVSITLTDGTSVEGKVFYHFTTPVNLVQCPADLPSSTAILLTAGGKCYSLIAYDRSKNKYAYYTEINDEKKKTDGFVIQSTTSDFAIIHFYDKDVTTPKIEFAGIKMIVTTSDTEGVVDFISKFTAEHKFIIPLVIIALGVILLFFGGNQWKAILAISGFMVGVILVLSFFFVLVNFNYNTTSFVIIGILALVIGLLAGYLTYHLAIISYIVIGFPSGWFLATLILTLVKLQIEKEVN